MYSDNVTVPYTFNCSALQACTGGGCTTSTVSNATTEEDSPEGVPVPTVVSPSPYELIVTWGIPKYPNGKKIAIVMTHLYSTLLTIHYATALLLHSDILLSIETK
jgi:usherin